MLVTRARDMRTAVFTLVPLATLVYVAGYSFESYFNIDDAGKWITCTFDETLDLDTSEMRIHFYDFENNYYKNYSIAEAPSKITTYQNWRVNKSIIAFMPGFQSDVTSITSIWMREAARRIKNDSYLVIIDYEPYTYHVLTAEHLENATTYMYSIGKAGAHFLVELEVFGVSMDNVHLVGHSSGSHLLSILGRSYESYTSKNLRRITTVDPAKPCFYNAPIEYKISSGKADYVEVYHCTNYSYGINETLGDVDFYYNKQMDAQPGCYDGIIIPTQDALNAEGCGHLYCFKFWSDTIGRPGLYKACSKDEKNCTGDSAIAGYYNPGNVFGVYYASTEI